MDLSFKNNRNFKDIIRKKEKEIMTRTGNGIPESEKFKEIHSSLLSYLNNHANLDFKVILIDYDNFDSLNNISYDKLSETLNSHQGMTNNYLVLDRDLNIIEAERNSKYQDSNEARRIYTGLSMDYIVFLLPPNTLINYFIKGEDFGENIFYTRDAFSTYQKRKTIDQIHQVFDEYRIHLKNRNIYSKFFISKSHLLSIKPSTKSELDQKKYIEEYKHILENKPEDRFREDLRAFLGNKLKVVLITKECLLENLDRTDIYMVDESGFETYFIEVKWVGTSVHSSGSKIGTSFDEKHIYPNAIIQTVEYLRQLHLENKNVKAGYLVVFDARKEDCIDTCHGFNNSIFNELQQPHAHKYMKISDFRVKNENPS